MKKRLLLVCCLMISAATSLFFLSNENKVFNDFASSDVTAWQQDEVDAVLTSIQKKITKKRNRKLETYRKQIEKRWQEERQKHLQEETQQQVISAKNITVSQDQLEAAVAWAREFAKRFDPFTQLDQVLTDFEQGTWNTKKMFLVAKENLPEELKEAYTNLEITVAFLKERFKAQSEFLHANLSDLKQAIKSLKNPAEKTKFEALLPRLERITELRIQNLKK